MQLTQQEIATAIDVFYSGLEAKRNALKVVNEALPHGATLFTLEDFGIPAAQILLERLEEAQP